ncbi:MAG: hypothetical protein JXB88_12725 [Spirochaetales bacterium]|nr:hypothetical protein [Spirochaetales bacterium]
MKSSYCTTIFIVLVFTSFFSSGLTPEEIGELYGNGEDGTITIKSGYTVDIKALYENDTVQGVESSLRGLNKGLNHGAGMYNPGEGSWVNAVHFFIEPGAVLTAPPVGKAGNLTNGVIAIKCRGNFINNGTINLDGKGYAGSDTWYEPGRGPGGAPRTRDTRYGYGTRGGTAYPFSLKTLSYQDMLANWHYIYGSGGACGQDGKRSGGSGGAGGGALLIQAFGIFDTENGQIFANGMVGDYGDTTGDKDEGCSGGGGGGAGGTVSIQVYHYAYLGINRITALYGAGGEDSGRGHGDPNHGGGGGGGANFYNGSAGGKQHDKYFSGSGGAGSVGRIHIKGSFSGNTTYPPLLELTEMTPE